MKKTVKRIMTAALSIIMVLSVAPMAMAGEYVVQKGDNLSKIAPKYNTTWRNLAEINKLANPNLIFPNQILKVPDLEIQKPVVPIAPEIVEAVGLISLDVADITLNNNITPAFSQDITEYTMNVQSDIYGVKVFPVASEGAVVTVNGETVEGANGIVISLLQTSEYYGIDYSLDIEIIVTMDEETFTYNVEVIRENAADTYALFEEKTYEDVETGLTLPYLIYVPTNYDETKEYPIVFALHGSGQRGQTSDMVLKRYEMATIWAKDSEIGINECIVVAPHCATSIDTENWTTLMLYRDSLADNSFGLMDWSLAAYNLLEDVVEEYSVDENKIYMTGLSAGGFATFSIAIEHPDTFAALLPVCGGADPSKVEVLKDIPMWILHAEDDPTVDVEEYLLPTLEALYVAGIDYKLTLYAAGEVFHPSAHFSWTPAYADKEVRDWLFAQSK